MALEGYQHLGAFTIALIILGLSFLIRRWPQGLHMTFSQHAAQHTAAIWFYIMFFTVVLPLLYLFFTRWFTPQFSPTGLFGTFIAAALLLQYSVAIIPEIGGWKTTYHVVGSTISGICMLLALICLIFSPTINNGAKFITIVCAAIMCILLYIGGIHRIRHVRLLILQASYYAAFFIAIMVITYLGKAI